MAYASIDDLLATYSASVRPSADPGEQPEQVAYMTQLLEDITDVLIAELGFDFYSHPEHPDYEPDEERLLDGPGSHRLHVHSGIVSLSAVEIRSGVTSTWQELDEDDYRLVALYAAEGRPYDHVDLTGASRSCWPEGIATIRLTGVFGFASVPLNVKRATVSWARQAVTEADAFGGGQAGPDGLGRALSVDRAPDVAYRLMDRERRRYPAGA